MRTIKNLIEKEKKVYIYLENEDVRKKFASDCVKEGITFSDGVSPIQREMSDIMALLPDGKICFVGTVGRILFGSGNKRAVKIDYKKYMQNNDKYIIK